MKTLLGFLLFLSTTAFASHDLFPKDPFRHLESVPAGSSYFLTCKVQNNGEVCSSRFDVTFFISKDSTLDASDFLLKSKSYSMIGANTWIGIDDNFIIPQEVTPGDYYILYVVDKENNIAEANEENNLTSLPISVEARSIDIVLSNFRVKTVKNEIYLDYSLSNHGNNDSPRFNTAVYLSKDSIIDQTDIHLGSHTHSIEWGAAFAYGKTYSVPSGISQGNYYVIISFDDLEQVAEFDETNNSGSVEVLIGQ